MYPHHMFLWRNKKYKYIDTMTLDLEYVRHGIFAI